jgi:3-oxoacyl-[acyl-carrier protein] reductase
MTSLPKRVLVTGGSRGLGLAVCQRLLEEGFHVVTAARKLSSGLDALRQAAPTRLEYHPIDFADPAAPAKLVKLAHMLEGIDGFVANAAVGTEGLLTLTAEETLRESLQINLIAPMLLAREAIKGMLIRGGGSLIFVASVAARTGFSGLAVYGAAKGGLVSFSRALAREYGKRGIRSNAVLPGFLETEMSQSLDLEKRNRIVGRTALKRLGAAQDVAGVVSFLLSEQARYVTGTEIVVDGGLTA